MPAQPPQAEVPLIVIAGPTASGKTALAMLLAEQLDGEIVSCDSLAVYRLMEIGTAKPTPAERARIPHHCLDLYWPDQACTAGDYARAARAAIADIRRRGKLPIVAGGTGLYLRALLEGLAPTPARDEALRERLRESARRRGTKWLHRILERLDPRAADQIHANDTPKLVRAIEVTLSARSPQTKQWQAGRDPLQGYRVLQLGLGRNPEDARERLYARINQRAAAMFERGLLEETAILRARYGDACRNLAALGYAQASRVLRGEMTQAEAVLAAQQGHRNYAKRQLTWFRRDPAIHWLSGFGDDPATQAQALQLCRDLPVRYNIGMDSTTATAPAASGHASKYSRNQPYHSKVLTNERLTGPESEKETIHIELELEEGMTYTPGDAVGILPTNREPQVESVLKALGFRGDERVLDHYKVEISLHEALSTRLNIGRLGRGSINQFSKLCAPTVPDGPPVPAGLAALLGPENKAFAEEYVWGREFYDLAMEFPGIVTDPQQLFNILSRLTPRMYSIASSQAAHPLEVHTTVRVVRYQAHGLDRQGVASGHLGERAPVGSTMPIFLHENNAFRLPEDTNAPVIMIGPGTGIAPFRAFLEHRQAHGHTGQNWLFFGEQRSVSDYLYKEQFLSMHADGLLTQLHTAFSRDQHNKVYVQDRMTQNGAELYAWLERGAYFYVCGDASRMAKDVECALLDVIARGSNGTLEQASEYLAEMKKQKRYQRDVY